MNRELANHYADLRIAAQDRLEFWRLAHDPEVLPRDQAVYWRRWEGAKLETEELCARIRAAN